MDEQLFAGGGIAAYTWGSLLLESSSLAPVNGASITRTLAAVSAGTLPADSPRDQRSAVSLLHQLIHLQQDLATGLGAWDHVTTREPYLRLATQSRWLVWPNHEPPYREVVEQSLRELGENAFTEQVRQDLVAISDSTIALRQLRGGLGNRAYPDLRRAASGQRASGGGLRGSELAPNA